MTTYYVRDAISSDPSVLSRWGRQVENTLYLCYQDNFEVGEFKSDKEAIQAVEKKQTGADETARGAGAVFRITFDYAKLPRYVDHLYKKRTYGSKTTYQKVTGNPRGGCRANAGAKALSGGPLKRRSILLNDEDHAMFMELGGVRWLRTVLGEEIKKRQSKASEK